MSLSTACVPGASIERRQGDRVVTGRVISSEAYAWYARGVRHESEGRLGDAEHSYRRALGLDPQSGSTWAALGRLACPRSPEEARRVFARGLEDAVEKLPVLLGGVACALEHRDLDVASAWSQQALRVTPEDPEVTRALERTALAQGKAEEANRYRAAYESWSGRRRTKAPQQLEDDVFGSLEEIDRLLTRGELQAARRAAVGTLPPERLCSRLLALGHDTLARSEAERVLALTPDAAEARLVYVLTQPAEDGDGADETTGGHQANKTATATARSSRRDPLERLLPSGLERVSPLGLLLLAEYLSRHVNLEAGRTFLRQLDFQPSADPRELEVARRLGYTRRRPSLRL